VATVTLNHPERRNSLDDDDLQCLMDHVQTIHQDTTIRVAVLQAQTTPGHRPVFCAGYRLQGLAEGASAPRRFEQAVNAWAGLRVPSVAVLAGSVHGGATDLALACDLRLALPHSAWHMPACRMGLLFYPDGLRRYVSHLGPDLSKRAFLAGQPLSAAELASRGVVELAQNEAELNERLQQTVADLLAMAPLALEATKRHLNALSHGSWHAQAYGEDEQMIHRSRDLAEGRAALSEGRRPHFERQ
jgi:enoyl-CoA hydratase/carnithine racemase